jgi:hypothetical protein
MPTQLPNIDFSKATQIYLGADSACRCGCRGTYAKQGSRLFSSRENRIKNLTCDEVSDIEVDPNNEYVNISLPNNRAITVYFS